MQINMNVDPVQIIEAAAKMQLKDKLKLYDSIKDDIFEFEFRKILKSLRTDRLSDDDILKEVEHVRAKRYKNRG